MSLRSRHQPLYLRAAARLRRQVAKLEPGQRLPAESRLARDFEVSVATIREAIRLLIAEGLVEPQQGRGTVVLPLAERPVALLLNLDILDSRTSRYYLLATRECRRLLEEQGRLVRHYYGRVTAEEPAAPVSSEFFDDLNAGKLSGVIALGTFPEPRLIEALHALPSAGMYEGFPRHIRADIDHFLDLAIGHAVAEGRQRIAMLAWNGEHHPEFCNPAQFTAAMERHGLSASSDWHRGDLHPYLPGAGWETFREVWSARHEKPDALIITDDCLFPDAAQAIRSLGVRVPDDLLVISHSCAESPVSAPFPVARLNASAHRAARHLVDLLKLSPEQHAVITTRPELLTSSLQTTLT